MSEAVPHPVTTSSLSALSALGITAHPAEHERRVVGFFNNAFLTTEGERP
jgi:hypothetical protein